MSNDSAHSGPVYDDDDPPARRNTPSPQKNPSRGTSGCLALLIAIGGAAAGVAMLV